MLVGYAETGKTQLMQTICGKEFSEQYTASIGIDFLHSYWDYKGEIHKMQIWDVAGRERFRSISSAYVCFIRNYSPIQVLQRS